MSGVHAAIGIYSSGTFFGGFLLSLFGLNASTEFNRTYSYH